MGGLFWRKIDDVDRRIGATETAIGTLKTEVSVNNERWLHGQRTLDAIFDRLKSIDDRLDRRGDHRE